MITRARFIAIFLVACGGATHESPVVVGKPSAIPDAGGHLNDPDLNRPPAKKRLAIDWDSVKLASDADALALWKQIAPTGEDWQQRLDEVPDALQHALALALLHEGNFACAGPASACGAVPPVMTEPRADATLADPCLRRELALWSFDQLERTDAPALKDVLRKLVALPPPESQLVADALHLAAGDEDLVFELLAIAWKAGQRELVNGAMGDLAEPHLLEAVKLHIDGAYDVLTAKTQRAVFLAAIADEQLQAKTRVAAMSELLSDDDKLAPDLEKALIAATKSASCTTAAAADGLLVHHGKPAFAPTRPKATQPAALIHALCVAAAYEATQRADEPSPLLTFLPAKLERVTVTYDPYNDVDRDGDGDPHLERSTELVERASVTLPDLPDLLPALEHCAKSPCQSEEHAFGFTFKQGLLSRLEVREKPPCQKP